MTTHDNAPPPPEWKPDPAVERCIGCNAIRVSCEASIYFGSTCCGWCSHGLHPLTNEAPQVWDGDQA